MTAPDLSLIVPTKWKPWVAFVGSLLTFIVPTVLEFSTSLPAPWPAVIAAVVAGLTWLGVYKVPYAPKGTEPVIVPSDVPTTVHVSPTPGPGPSEVTVSQGSGPWRKNPWA